MEAVAYHGPGDICVDDVSDPRIEAPSDAVIRVTTGAICGTDLHRGRASLSGMRRAAASGSPATPRASPRAGPSSSPPRRGRWG
ncbi:MAG: hypothetical protein M0004_02965 [Actinomycetota bacterium]|nr:hypothetical protein [Actinomycetota bacterium]